MDVSLQNTKKELIQWLIALENQETIQKILDLKDSDDWRDSLSHSEKLSVQKGISDADLGKLNSHDKAREIYEKWL